MALIAIAITIIMPISSLLTVGLKGMLKNNEFSRILGEKVICQLAMGVFMLVYLDNAIGLSL